MPAKKPSNEINLTRIYDAPVKAVWDAWVDPKQAAKWWGPRGFSITTHSKDFKPGGHWTYTMHGPDGADYANVTHYHEIEKYSRLVYDHGSDGKSPPLFHVTVQFIDLKGKTELKMCMKHDTVEAADISRMIIKKASGNSTWDRLAEYLEKESTGKETFVINRTFDTPLKTMFEMWTNPKHFSKWLAPTGFNMNFVRSDIKPGASTFYYMSGHGDMKMYGRAEYLEVSSPNRIVYTQQFCDENEKVIRHPMSATWPETMLTTVLLTAEGPDQTRVTITWEPHGTISREELETFIQAKGGMTQGWTGSFDKLEEYLSKGESHV